MCIWTFLNICLNPESEDWMDSCKHISEPDCSSPAESRTINHTDIGLAFCCNSIQYICSEWSIIKECRNCYRWNITIKSLYKREGLERRQWTQLGSNVSNEAVGFSQLKYFRCLFKPVSNWWNLTLFHLFQLPVHIHSFGGLGGRPNQRWVTWNVSSYFRFFF